jgi:hypothetical protein
MRASACFRLVMSRRLHCTILVDIADEFNVDKGFVLRLQRPMLERDRLFGLQFGKPFPALRNARERQYVTELVVEKVVAAVAQHLDDRGIGVHDSSTLRVEQKNAILGGFKQPAIANPGGVQLLVLGGQLFLCGAQGQMRLDPGEKFLNLERLADIVDRSCRECRNFVSGVGQRGHEDYGDVACARVRLEPAAGLKAVDSRHHHVKKDEVRLDQSRPLDALFAIPGDQDLELVGFQIVDRNSQVSRDVVHDQYGASSDSG